MAIREKLARRRARPKRSLQLPSGTGSHHLFGALDGLNRRDAKIIAGGKEPEAVATSAVGANAGEDFRRAGNVHIAGKFILRAGDCDVRTLQAQLSNAAAVTGAPICTNMAMV